MRVLVVGSGAREHAIVWKLSQSDKVNKLFCAPGNAGIAEIAECVDIKANDIYKLRDFALENKIDITVVGPEIALVDGIVDIFDKKGMRIFGPNQRAAQLEGSKVFAKDFMQKYKIPTARYKTCCSIESAIEELQHFRLPVVIKADGLAAGKGVIIAQNRQEAVIAICDIMGDKKFGEAGKSIVLEEYLHGKEVSVLAFVDGNTVLPMVSAQDYKRALNGDKGLNTGGMGAVSPALYYNEEIEQIVKSEIIDKTMKALKSENINYKGIIYFGIMLTVDGPKVLEYNVRFGDPETEVILPRLQTDFLDVICAVVDSKLNQIEVSWSKEKAICVVMASGGYPEEYKTGYMISGIEEVESEAKLFHAGTSIIDGKLVTSGGRVLVISGMGENYEAARDNAYKAVKKINFRNAHFREDIGRI